MAHLHLVLSRFKEYHQNKRDRALKDFERAYELDPTLYAQIGEAFSDSIRHDDATGLEILHELENRIEQRGVGDPEATYKIAQGYAVLKDAASGARMLRASVQNGFFAYPYFVRDPLLENLRNEEQFPGIMATARHRYEAFRRKFF